MSVLGYNQYYPMVLNQSPFLADILEIIKKVLNVLIVKLFQNNFLNERNALKNINNKAKKLTENIKRRKDISLLEAL